LFVVPNYEYPQILTLKIAGISENSVVSDKSYEF